MAAVAIRGTTYPIVLPKLRDPRLHLAATITSLQVLGQVAFHFRLSIAQILLCLGTVAVIEVAITLRQQHVLMWPASALLTGNGVAFVLRVPGTQHGDWWSLHGWWIFVATAGGSLLSKYVIGWKGEHVFNPSNIGLVVVFLALGRARVEPLDFWWGPMSWWMALALAIIVTGGFAILRRLKLLRVALSFWAAFAAAVGVIALTGHAMTARWHLGPLQGWSFWWVLVTSPEVLVFLFFMITDPKTAPRDLRARVVYGVTLGVLAALLIAPTRTEFAAKVALLSALAVVCAARSLLQLARLRVEGRALVLAGAAGLAGFAAVAAFANSGQPRLAAEPAGTAKLPPIRILPSPGVQTQLDLATAEQIAYGVVAAHPAAPGDTLRVHLVPGTDQSPPYAVAQLAGSTYELHQTGAGAWSLPASAPAAAPAITSRALRGTSLADVAPALGVDFRQGSFSSGVTNDVKAMMGGGVCWLDYNGDGRLDLFAVNSYASADTARPTSELFENTGSRFRNVTRSAHAGLAVQGDGCAAGDLNGDGRTDLVVTTTTGAIVLWNRGGTFARADLPAPSGWYTGVAIADVNGDGRPDVFAAGYSDPNQPVPGSYAGFPTNLEAVRDVLFLNEGGGRFREVGRQAGIEAAFFRHGLGVAFLDANGDGRPDLYVANDEDPNQLYVNVPWPGGAAADPAHLGFRFEERAGAARVDDPFAGMGIAFADNRLVVTNSRGEPSAAYRKRGTAFVNDRPSVDGALGSGFAGWGATWVDLTNSGAPDLVLAAGAIPVTNLDRNAEPMRVLAPVGATGLGTAKGVLPALTLNGRGVAAADAFNDGRELIAVNTIGGRLALLQARGPSGHWLDVALSRFVPGAVVSADGATRTVQAGSSYLSSEDPRAHFGLGSARVVRKLVVTYPWGATSVLRNVRGDRVVTVRVPQAAPAVHLEPPVPCARPHGTSVARIWDDAAVSALRAGDASEPVQARDLYDLSLAISQAYAAVPAARRDAVINTTAYRLLLWQASYDANLAQVFAQLTTQFRKLCTAPSALGARIANAAIARGAHDGSNEALHYADPTYTPRNEPLVVAQAGSTVHDATFWQPLSFGRAKVQRFEGSQWGRVSTFAGKVPVPAPHLGDPSGKTYRDAAAAAVRALSPSRVDPSPAGWNAVLPSRGLAWDVHVDLALNAALNDAAVSAYAAKRQYESPRPIEMIRYLAFNGLLHAAPRWTPPATTPPSPGYPSTDAAFAYAADGVLSRFGSPSAGRARRAAHAGVANGTELAVDEAAGEQLGRAVARRVLAKVR